MWKARVKIGFERPNPLHMRWLVCALVDSCTADEQKLLRSTCLCPICNRSIPPGPEVNSCLVQEGGSEDKTEHETLADRHPCLLPKPQNNNGHKKLVFSYTILQHFCRQIIQICVQQTGREEWYSCTSSCQKFAKFQLWRGWDGERQRTTYLTTSNVLPLLSRTTSKDESPRTPISAGSPHTVSTPKSRSSCHSLHQAVKKNYSSRNLQEERTVGRQLAYWRCKTSVSSSDRIKLRIMD